MNILLVDDSSTMRTIVRRCIEKCDLGRVMEAADGKEALQIYEQLPFQLIVSDWNMPEMDGLELLQEIRKRNATIPFVMITTEAEAQRVTKAIQNGVSDYLIKPFEPEALKQKLTKWTLQKTSA